MTYQRRDVLHSNFYTFAKLVYNYKYTDVYNAN